MDNTRGLPAYGQVFLAEALGALVMVLLVLNLKYAINVNGRNPYFYPIGYTVCSIGLHQMFKDVSGGIFNPALSIA